MGMSKQNTITYYKIEKLYYFDQQKIRLLDLGTKSKSVKSSSKKIMNYLYSKFFLEQTMHRVL